MPSSNSSYVCPSISKPIAIIRHNNHNHDDHLFYVEDQEELQEQSEKMFYEGATWRLYNRIVDHRLHSPPQRTTAPIYNNDYDYDYGAAAAVSPTIHNYNTSSGCSPQQQQHLVRPKARYAQLAAPAAMMLDHHYSDHHQQHDAMGAFVPPFMEDADDEIFELEL